jgi:hypothetical protein
MHTTRFNRKCPHCRLGALTVCYVQLLSDLAHRSAAWRRFPRREHMAAALVSSFGAAAMEDYWDSIAGDVRLRQ